MSNWKRDWELAFRISDIIWSRIGDRPEVLERRQKLINQLKGPCTQTSKLESERFSPHVEGIDNWIETNWTCLFDQFFKSTQTFVFEDGFALLFFLRILWSNDTILLRGQYDASWRLSSSLERAKNINISGLDEIKNSFLQEILSIKAVQMTYGDKIPLDHQNAILQHYGFPTTLLDFTYSYDVALFFAEGGSDHLPIAKQASEMGSIFAIPSNALPYSTKLITLPASILRPSLQRGVFIDKLSSDEKYKLDKYKFQFFHRGLPVWNGLGNIPFGSSVAIGKYLFPMSDPIARTAKIHFNKISF